VATDPTKPATGLGAIQIVGIALGGIAGLICLVALLVTIRRRAKEASLSKMRRKDSRIHETYLAVPKPPTSVGFAVDSPDDSMQSVRSARSATSAPSLPPPLTSSQSQLPPLYQPTVDQPPATSFPEPNGQYGSLLPLVDRNPQFY
jgi:hypothetical protein